jgi:hypothetical protein
MYRYAALVALCVATYPASAGDLVALQGGSVDLGAYQGVVYYTEAEDGYRVVATITAEEGTPVRFVATLADGQQLVISTPGKLDEADRALEISRAAGKLVITSVEPLPETVLAQ